MNRRLSLLSSIFIFFALPLTAEVIMYPGEWEEKGGVKKLFDTPLGALYQFDDSKSYQLKPALYPEHEEDCNCQYCRQKNNPPRMGGGLLQVGFLKNSKRNAACVAIDFKVRAFPALDKKTSAQFRFFLTRSEKNKISTDYGDLNALVEITSRPVPIRNFSTAYFLSLDKYEKTSSLLSLYVPNPAYEPIAYRLVFHATTGKLDVYQNGFLISSCRHEMPLKGHSYIEIRNFGILIQEDGESRNYREEYLEISNPVVRMTTSSKELLEKTPPAGFSPYPYGNYYGMVKNDKPDRLYREIRNHKNPDLQYAWALQLLYGPEPDPAEALELLERAAKEKHVLALYQLGVCYWRGYGVEPDLEKATRYLKEAAQYRYPAAWALQWLIAWRETHQAWFPPETLRDDFIRETRTDIGSRTTSSDETVQNISTSVELTFPGPQAFEHDLIYLNRLLNHVYSVPAETVVTPKFLMDTNFSQYLVSADPAKKNLRYVDYAIAGGYFPAHYEAVKEDLLRLPATLSDAEKKNIESHLKAGVAAGDPAATPGWLLFRARNNQLKREDFTPLQELCFSDNPVWLFLKFAVENQDYQPMRAWLADGVETESDNSVNGKVFQGLCRLLPRALRENGILNRFDQPEMQRIFELLQEGAGENPIAQCWIGQRYYNGDLPENIRQRGEFYHRQQAQQYFEAAAKGGMLKAKFMLLVFESENAGSRVDDLLKRLDEFCNLNYAPAWMLRGKVLCNALRHNEAKTAYRRASELGEPRGLLELALYADREKNKEEANRLYGEYIQADLRCRMFDRFDPFWPDIYGEIGKWKYGSSSKSGAEMIVATVPAEEGEAGGEELKEPEKPEEERKPHPLFDKKKKDTEPKPRKTKVLNP